MVRDTTHQMNVFEIYHKVTMQDRIQNSTLNYTSKLIEAFCMTATYHGAHTETERVCAHTRHTVRVCEIFRQRQGEREREGESEREGERDSEGEGEKKERLAQLDERNNSKNKLYKTDGHTEQMNENKNTFLLLTIRHKMKRKKIVVFFRRVKR